MRRMLGLALVLTGVAALMPTVAQAHVLQSDASIGAVLHVLPDDAPIAGVATNYELAFTDTRQMFNVDQCRCTVTVRQNGAAVTVAKLRARSDTEGAGTVSFPEAGIYNLEITGEPQQPGAFQSFKLSFPLRVQSTDGGAAQGFPPLLGLGIGLGVGLILLAAVKMEHDGNITQDPS